MKARISLDGYHLPIIQFEDRTYTAINISGDIYTQAKELWCNAIMNNSHEFKMVAIFDHVPKSEYAILEVELNAKLIVIPNYNGYTTAWVATEDDTYCGKKDCMSLKEYDLWNATHKATYKDDTWVYVPI